MKTKDHKKKINSRRKDHRGHWQSGQRRHDPGPGWRDTLILLRRRLAHPIRGVVSIRAVAADLAVNESTIRNWLSEIDLPSARHASQVRSWLDRHRTDRAEQLPRQRSPLQRSCVSAVP